MKDFKDFFQNWAIESADNEEVKQVDCEISGLEKITSDTAIVMCVKENWQAEAINRVLKGDFSAVAVAFNITAQNYNLAAPKIAARLNTEQKPTVMLLRENSRGTAAELDFTFAVEENGCRWAFVFFNGDFVNEVLKGAVDFRWELVRRIFSLYEGEDIEN